MREYKIYVLFDKRGPGERIRYTGRTCLPLEKRLRGHFNLSRGKLRSWIEEVGPENVGIKEVDSALGEGRGRLAEQWWIENLTRNGLSDLNTYWAWSEKRRQKGFTLVKYPAP